MIFSFFKTRRLKKEIQALKAQAHSSFKSTLKAKLLEQAEFHLNSRKTKFLNLNPYFMKRLTFASVAGLSAIAITVATLYPAGMNANEVFAAIDENNQPNVNGIIHQTSISKTFTGNETIDLDFDSSEADDMTEVWTYYGSEENDFDQLILEREENVMEAEFMILDHTLYFPKDAELLSEGEGESTYFVIGDDLESGFISIEDDSSETEDHMLCSISKETDQGAYTLEIDASLSDPSEFGIHSFNLFQDDQVISEDQSQFEELLSGVDTNRSMEIVNNLEDSEEYSFDETDNYYVFAQQYEMPALIENTELMGGGSMGGPNEVTYYFDKETFKLLKEVQVDHVLNQTFVVQYQEELIDLNEYDRIFNPKSYELVKLESSASNSPINGECIDNEGNIIENGWDLLSDDAKAQFEEAKADLDKELEAAGTTKID